MSITQLVCHTGLNVISQSCTKNCSSVRNPQMYLFVVQTRTCAASLCCNFLMFKAFCVSSCDSCLLYNSMLIVCCCCVTIGISYEVCAFAVDAFLKFYHRHHYHHIIIIAFFVRKCSLCMAIIFLWLSNILSVCAVTLMFFFDGFNDVFRICIFRFDYWNSLFWQLNAYAFNCQKSEFQ